MIFLLERVFDIVTGYLWYLSGDVLGVVMGREVVQGIRHLYQILSKLRVVLITGTYVKSHFFVVRLSQVTLTKFICSKKNNVFYESFD